MARPKTRPDTVMKPFRLDAALVAEVDALRNDQTFTDVVEESLRRWIKAKRRALPKP